jgi:hypothetical protein
MAGRGVVIKGVRTTISKTKKQLTKHRRKVKSACNRVGADLLRKARDNSPVQTGMHIDSMSNRIIDLGWGNGFIIEVSGGDTPYSQWLHEGHYVAHPPHGTSSFVRLIGQGRTMTVQGAVAMSMHKKGGGTAKITGFWYDAKGNQHGRKFLTRALDANKRRYIKNLEKAGKR